MPTYPHFIRLTAFALNAVVAFYLGFIAFQPSDAAIITRKAGYWIILVTVSLLIWNLAEIFRDTVRSGSKFKLFESKISLKITLLVVGFLSVLLLSSQPYGFKILMDEPVLASTSYQMHKEKEVFAGVRAFEIDGVFHVSGIVDKRPLFFPFLLSLLHDFTGWRPLQGLVLNTILTPIFLFSVFLIGRRIFPKYGGYLALLLWVTIPLFPMVATSAGFDLLNLVMIQLAAITAYMYLSDSKPTYLNLFLLTTILLAQTRYESILFIFATGVCVIFVWWRDKQIQLTWAAVFIPYFLIIPPLQRIVMSEHKEEYMQLGGSIEQSFSLSYFPDNIRHALGFFFHMGSEQMNSLLVSCLFVLSLLIAIIYLYKKKSGSVFSNVDGLIGICFATIIIINFLILMVYHWGQIDDTMATRLVLPLLLVQVYLVIWAASFIGKSKMCVAALFIVSLMFYFLHTYPVCKKTNFISAAITKPYVDWVMQTTYDYRDRGVLVVCDIPLAPILNEVSTLLTIEAIFRRADLDMHLRLKTFSEILVTKIVPADPSHPYFEAHANTNEKLEKAFSLEIISEVDLNKGVKARLFRVTDIYLEKNEKPDFKKKTNGSEKINQFISIDSIYKSFTTFPLLTEQKIC